MFDHSVCDFCPYDTEYSTVSGNVCESCQARQAERELMRHIVDLLDE